MNQSVSLNAMRGKVLGHEVRIWVTSVTDWQIIYILVQGGPKNWTIFKSV